MRFVDTVRRARVLSRRNKSGETALHCAATLGLRAGLDPRTVPVAKTLQVLIWLVESGCDVNARDKDGRTALHRLFTSAAAAAANAAVASEGGSLRSSTSSTGGAAGGGGGAFLRQSSGSGASAFARQSSGGGGGKPRRRGSLSPNQSSRKGADAALAAALALVRKGADMSVKCDASAGGTSPLDLCTEEQVQQMVILSGNIGKVDYFPLLREPLPKVPNCCYVSMLVEKSTMQTDGLQRPFLTASFYKLSSSGSGGGGSARRVSIGASSGGSGGGSSSGSGGGGGGTQLVEAVQSVTEPCVTRPDYLWWGSTIHLQSPLENFASASDRPSSPAEESSSNGSSGGGGGEGVGSLPSGLVVLLELKDMGGTSSSSNPSTSPSKGSGSGSGGSSGSGSGSSSGGGVGSGGAGACVAWTVLEVGKKVVDTKDNVQLEMYAYPVDLRKRKVDPVAMFLSVDVVLTRAEDHEAAAFGAGGDSNDELSDGGDGDPSASAARAAKTTSKKSLPKRESILIKRESRRTSAAAAPPLPPRVNVADQLTKLSGEFAAGLISGEEFKDAKKTILGLP